MFARTRIAAALYFAASLVFIVALSATFALSARFFGPGDPFDTTRPYKRDGAWWREAHEEINARIEQGNVDLIFVGDSITQGWRDEGWDTWHEYYAPRNAVNLGIGGDSTQHILWRLRHGNIDGIHAKLAIILIGTNSAHTNTPQEIADGIEAVVNELRLRLPDTKILLLAIFPRDPGPTPAREIVAEASALASGLADGEFVHYLDIGEVFLENDGTISDAVLHDYVHLSPEGYRRWAEAIEATVQRLMDETD